MPSSKIQGLLSLCHLLDSSFGQAVKARLYALVHLLFKEGSLPGEVRQDFMQPPSFAAGGTSLNTLVVPVCPLYLKHFVNAVLASSSWFMSQIMTMLKRGRGFSGNVYLATGMC